MRQLVTIPLTLILSCLVPPVLAEDHVVEATPQLTFVPAELTIQVGDTVTWRNTGGNHNVDADDGSFRCAEGCSDRGGDGSPSTAAWEFTRTFDEGGMLAYHCDIHGAPGGAGMAGTVTIEESSDQPGALRFGQSGLSKSEDGGQFDVGVERVNGSDGGVSVDYATSDGSATAGSDYTAASGTLSWADGESTTKSFQVPITDDGDPESDETVNASLSNPTGGAALGTPSNATLTIRDDDQAPQSGQLGFASDSFSVDETAGTKTIPVERSGGTSGMVEVDYATSDGSAIAGSDYNAASGTLSWADGEGGTKSFDVPIVDDEEEENDEMVNLSLSDPSGGASLGTSSATLAILDDDRTGDCVDTDTVLCLGEGDRFKVTVEWETTDDTGQGQVERFGNVSSGLFYFFGEDNIELLLKVLDACGINERFWFFSAATTDVGFVITVMDTEADVTKTYSNELGSTAETVTDTDAFATCP